MLKPISFTSDYKVKIKIKESKNKKQAKKEQNYINFQKCCETLTYGIDGVMFSSEEFSAGKFVEASTTLHVPNDKDSVVESFLIYNNIKFKKKSGNN